MSALPFATIDVGPLGPRDDAPTLAAPDLVAAVLRVAAEEEQAAVIALRSLPCSRCGDDRAGRGICPCWTSELEDEPRGGVVR